MPDDPSSPSPGANPEAGIEHFLANYPESVATLSLALRDLVLTTAPDAQEKLHTGWRVIAYGHATSGRKFCAIAPHTRWVNLQFHNGAALSGTLLQGTGKTMRHVKIAEPDHLRDPQVRKLISAAALAAAG